MATRVELIRRRRATRPTRRRPPVQPHPDNIAREYARAIMAIMHDAHAKVLAAVVPAFKRFDPQHLDADETIKKVIGDLKIETFKKTNKRAAGLLAQGVGNRVVRFTDKAVGNQVKAVIGVNPLANNPRIAPFGLQPFVKENVALIKTVPERYFVQVQALVDESFVIGRHSQDVARLLVERFKVSETNATRIARDQVSKLNGQVTQARQTDLGITHYFWRTSRDERVRGDPSGQYPKADPSHFALEGTRWAWSDPPPETGHPGEDIQCVPAGARVTLLDATEKAFRRRYCGDLTELVTDTHEALATTPNHPVLTRRGWIPAQLVEVGDYLVEVPAKLTDVGVKNPQRREAEASDLFRALAALGIKHRIPGIASGFHGDGTDEKIDVVAIDRSLLLESDQARSEKIREDLFTFAAKAPARMRDLAHRLVTLSRASDGIVSGFRQAHALAFARAFHAHEHRSALSAAINPIRDQDPFDAVTRASEIPSDRKLAFAAQVGAHDLSFVRVNAIVRRAFDGEVFNFETHAGWYGASGLIVHNCRCRAEPDMGPLLGDAFGPVGVDVPQPDES